MTKIDPIIAVNDVGASAAWYQSVFGWVHAHGGDHFAVMKSTKGEVLLCLHEWGEDGHPTMTNPDITPGNGLILYYKTDDLKAIHDKVTRLGGEVEEDMHLNENSRRMEFSLRDPDGYCWFVTEYHEYER